MAGIVEFPQLVQEALRDFGDRFANEPQRRHFAEYLTGLYLAARKTVTGINAKFARTTDPSWLNRYVHLDAWDDLRPRKPSYSSRSDASRWNWSGSKKQSDLSAEQRRQLI